MKAAKNTKTGRLLWQGLLLGALTLPLNYLVLSCFPGAQDYALFVLPCASILLAYGLRALLEEKLEALAARQFCSFLEYLNGRIAAGNNLTHVLLAAPSWLKQHLGARSKLYLSLCELARSLNLGMDLEQSLQAFQNSVQIRASAKFCQLLPRIEKAGGKLELYLRETRRALDSELVMNKEIAAEQSALASEALILSLLPPLLSYVSTRGEYGVALQEQAWARLAEAAFFLLSYLALALCLYFLQTDRKLSSSLPSLPHLAVLPAKHLWLEKLANAYKKTLPSSAGFLLEAALLRQRPGAKALAWVAFFSAKLELGLAAALVALSLGCWGILGAPSALPLAFCPLLCFFLPDLSLLSKERELRTLCRAVYPGLVNLLAILLASGLSLQRSLELILASEQELNKAKPSLLQRDLERLNKRLASGVAAPQALEDLALNIAIPEISQVLILICRYANEGGQELLEIIRLQAEQTRSLFRQAQRRRLGRRALLLLLPMAIDLFVILALSLLPALASFQLI